MARSTTTFESGNRTGEKLTPETHELFVNTIRITGRLSVAAARCCVGGTTVRGWLRRGGREESGMYREFLDDVERARAEFLLLASRRLGQLAVGGVLQLPAYDKKTGAPLRNHRKDCPAIPGVPCGCELIVVERVMLPNPQALMFQLDRSDPSPNLETQQPDVPAAPEQTDAEQIAEAAKYFDLFRAGIQCLIDLGCPPTALLAPRAKAIETSATKVEPAKPVDVADGLEPATPCPSTEPTAKAKPPEVPDAF